MKTEFVQLTHIGLVRENNEDSLWVNPDQGLYLLADGMGGHNAGEVASELACQYLSQELLSLPSPKPHQRKERLEESIQKVHQAVFDQSESHTEQKGMGTTLDALWLSKNIAYGGHVGDSRIYCIQESKIQQLTEDHTRVAELIENGELTQEQAQHSPMSHVLTQAIGTPEPLIVHTFEIKFNKGDHYCPVKILNRHYK